MFNLPFIRAVERLHFVLCKKGQKGTEFLSGVACRLIRCLSYGALAGMKLSWLGMVGFKPGVTLTVNQKHSSIPWLDFMHSKHWTSHYPVILISQLESTGPKHDVAALYGPKLASAQIGRAHV